jgi:hypothetical protein
MYTLLELESKTFGELKKIGYELNVLPKGDRRCRQSWIDALVNVNPPLLQLLEDSPAASVDPVSEAVAQAVENTPGVDFRVNVDSVQEPIVPAAETSPATPAFQVGDLVHSKTLVWGLERKSMTGTVLKLLPRGGVRVQFGDHISGYGGSFDFSKSQLKEDLIRQEPIIKTVDNSPAASVEQAKEVIEVQAQEAPIESKFGRIVYPRPTQGAIGSAAETSTGVEVDPVEESIVPAKNFPGSCSKASIAHQLLELFQSTAHIIEDSPGVKTEATVSESAIAPFSAKNPILTGVTFSDRFLARYSPPQTQIIHFQLDADGQLSLLDFEVQSVDEPPDPDDFESLDAFREALARWDLEHPSSSSSFDRSDHLPSSEDNDVSSEDNDVSSEDKPLELSLDSFCLWAHCPADWYEPAALLKPSKVMELSPVHKNSSTSDFFIPTFNCWSDRFNRSDEPPDTGIFSRLPKPKPPNFPPQSASWTQVGHKLDTSQSGIPKLSRNYPETIPKLFHRVVAGSSTQPARSPPGGDAKSQQ